MPDRIHVLGITTVLVIGVLTLAAIPASISPDAASAENSIASMSDASRNLPDSQEADTVDTRPIRLLMVELGQEMNRISDGLWHEDYDMIRRAGRSIADHPKITPEQMETIRSALGDRFQQFVGYDQVVHEAADRLAAAAAARSLQGILEERTQLTNSCIGCHTTFRNEVRQALY